MRTPSFEIGYQFIQARGKKRRDVETIVDILTTTNSKGEAVKIEYVAVHDFCGQQLRATHIETTIAMSEKV
jgi:hypothetical protein